MNRRDFLKGSGALIVSFRMGEWPARAQFGGPVPGAPAMNQLDSWIAIAADGSVTAYSGKEELGQGIATAQTQLIAEELSVPFDRVKLIYCDTALTPDQAYTAGSQSHPANFNHSNLGLAGATAREALLKLGSQRLGAPVDQLVAKDGVVSFKSSTARKVSYGELIGGKRFNLTLDPAAKRKPASEWTVLGKPVLHPDLQPVVLGQFEFVHNVKLPGMLHGRVVRPPAVGANVVSVDEDSVKGMPGLVKVVVRKNFVGVVAEKPWQAMQAAAKLKINWSAGSGLPAQTDFYDHMRADKQTRDNLLANSKDVDQKLGQAATVLRATYKHPYQMHGSMGSSCAVSDVQGDRATIYSPTQGVWYQRSTCGMLLGLKPENVHVIFRRGSGCYGLNGADTVTYDAAILSQAVGKPVRVQLTRKDEMAWENYGNSYLIDQRAGLDMQGNIVVWDHESWSPGLGNRPGPGTPGNVITGFLAGFEPDGFAPRAASEPAGYNNNSNGVPSYLAARFNGSVRGTGKIESGRVLVHNLKSPFWTGPLRSPARLQNTFAHESFLDEIAAEVKADPVEYRLRHLSHPRLSGVVQAAAKAANWETRPSPRAGRPRTGVATGRGIACVAYEGDNGYSALVAEVEVHQDTGKIVVTRIVVAGDCGPISNPDGLRNQMEGGALQGMSRALGEEVTWDAEKVTSIDWRTYHSLPLGFELPKIECVLLNRPEEEANGAGELSITVVAAAIGNAVFDATGMRLRQIPFTPERLKAALA
jgi:CO/xanthine dehydrogenase Mo-binding subunit